MGRYGDASVFRCIICILGTAHYMINETVPAKEYYLASIDRIASSPRVNQSRRFERRNLTDKSVNYKNEYIRIRSTSLNKLVDMIFKH